MDGDQHDSNPQPSMQMQQQHHSMQGQHPYSNGHHTPDYRASPTQHNNALSHAPHLPPIHQFEGSAMQSQQPQYAPAPMNGAQMPHPPPYNPHQFQYANGPMQPPPMPSNLAINGQSAVMRYPIPPQGPLPMAQARAAKNKEVKRRTKTGCLTCRKRRIKCDEGQPTCRNCAKSKRECMGYDPIFKQQTGPAPIQPAPASATTPTQKSTPTSATLPSNVYPQQQTFPGTGSTFVAAAGNFVSPTQSHSTDAAFEYGPSLDPALAGGDAALTMAANSYNSTLQPARQVRYISMEQLFSLNDVPPQYQHREAPPPGSMPPQRDIDEYYKYHYGPGLDRIFETTWYTSRGLNRLQQDPALLDFTAQCMERMTSQAEDPASVDACRSLEARLVWKLATMPRPPPHSHNLNGVPTDPLTTELLPRIDTLEALLTGQFLPPSQIPTPPSPQSPADRETHSRQTFWHHLGRFASIRDDTPGPHHDIADTLATLRGILGGMENRDVLYSIAIARHIGGRLLEFHPPNRLQASTDDPNDEVKKLQVACDFVAAEDQRGTTQVIQRVCGMAIRGWMLQRQ